MNISLILSGFNARIIRNIFFHGFLIIGDLTKLDPTDAKISPSSDKVQNFRN